MLYTSTPPTHPFPFAPTSPSTLAFNPAIDLPNFPANTLALSASNSTPALSSSPSNLPLASQSPSAHAVFKYGPMNAAPSGLKRAVSRASATSSLANAQPSLSPPPFCARASAASTIRPSVSVRP